MKFSSLKGQLYTAIQNVIRIVPNVSTVPIITGILFCVTDDILTLTATDFETSITSSIPVMNSEPGEVVLPGKYIFDIIRKLPDGMGSFSIDPMTWKCVIKAENSKFQIYGQPSDDFPRNPERKSEIVFNINSQILSDMITKTTFAAGVQEKRSYIAGVSFSIQNNKLKLAATDTFRLALNTETISLEPQDDTDVKQTDFEVIVPAKILNDVAKILSQINEEIQVRVGDGFILFRTSSTTVTTRLIDDKFLDYETVLLADPLIKVYTDREDLVSAAERAGIINRKEAVTKLSLEADKIILSASASDIGELYEEIEAKKDGEDMEIGIDINYLIEALRYLDAEKVVLGFISPLRPIFLQVPEEDNALQVIMPMRLG